MMPRRSCPSPDPHLSGSGEEKIEIKGGGGRSPPAPCIRASETVRNLQHAISTLLENRRKLLDAIVALHSATSKGRGHPLPCNACPASRQCGALLVRRVTLR